MAPTVGPHLYLDLFLHLIDVRRRLECFLDVDSIRCNVGSLNCVPCGCQASRIATVLGPNLGINVDITKAHKLRPATANVPSCALAQGLVLINDAGDRRGAPGPRVYAANVLARLCCKRSRIHFVGVLRTMAVVHMYIYVYMKCRFKSDSETRQDTIPS